MIAGREFDALVAEKVMGLTVHRVGDGEPWVFTIHRDYVMGGDYWYETESGAADEVPYYSTDIAAAWQVIEHFYRAGWGAGASMDGHTGCEASVGQFSARADTAPLAICLAALKAVGVEV